MYILEKIKCVHFGKGRCFGDFYFHMFSSSQVNLFFKEPQGAGARRHGPRVVRALMWFSEGTLWKMLIWAQPETLTRGSAWGSGLCSWGSGQSPDHSLGSTGLTAASTRETQGLPPAWYAHFVPWLQPASRPSANTPP